MASESPRAAPPTDRRWRLLAPMVVVILTLLVFAPTLRNGFLLLGFDDSLILDNPEVRELSWASARRIFTTFRHANYIPLTTLSFAVSHRLAGFDPFAYHLANIALHAGNAVLVWLLLHPLVRSAAAATFATLVFALHPLQLEAVSLAIQRKTLLSATFFLLALLAMRRWWERGTRWCYTAALLAFAASVLAKPITVTFPIVALLYEHQFVRRRPRVAEKIPFFLVSLAGAWLAMEASLQVGAVKHPHGGTWLRHAAMMGRASAEYIGALFAPLNLSPIYYYRAGTELAPWNILSLCAVLLLIGFVLAQRRRLPWSFFCFAWFAVLLFPQSNVLPLAQLRPDRYLYLSLVGLGLWLAIGLRQAVERWPERALVLRVGAAGFVAALAIITFTSAPVWRSDVSAWTRVVRRNPWCAVAYQYLGQANYDAGDARRAVPALETALRLKPELAGARSVLAKSYAQLGERQ